MSISGTRPGTFQYVPRNGRIPVAVNNIYDYTFENCVYAKFISPLLQKRLSLQDSRDGKIFESRLYITEDDIDDSFVELYNGVDVKKYFVEYVDIENPSLYELIEGFTGLLSNKISESLNQSGKEEILNNLNSQARFINMLENGLQDLNRQLAQAKVVRQKSLAPFVDLGSQLIRTYQKCMKGGRRKEELDNLEVAELSDLSNKIKLKKQLERKLSIKQGDNYDRVIQEEEEAQSLKSSVNLKALESKYKNSIPDTCALSHKNWLQAISQGDCLCLSFEGIRPKSGSSNIHQYEIAKVNEMLFTADTFMNSKLFFGKSGQIVQGNSKFNIKERVKANQLEKGLRPEVVNGLMPLFINEAHWQFGQKRLKALLGWTLSVDIFGFKPEFLQVVPYKVLGKAFSDGHPLYSTILETVMTIYRENRDVVLQDINDKTVDYEDLPETRVRENIPDNTVFLMKLYCALYNGDVQDEVKALLPLIFEEELRRQMNPTQNAQKFIGDLLGMNTDDITQLSNPQYLYQVLKGQQNPQFRKSISKLTPLATKLIQNINNELNKEGSPLFNFASLFELFEIDPYTSLEDLGLTSNEQVLTFLLQNTLQHDDGKRVSEIRKGNFIDLFNQDTAKEQLDRTYTNSVLGRVKSLKDNPFQEVKAMNLETAREFAQSPDLQQAASILSGTKQGSPFFMDFFRALCESDPPNLFEKLKMLTTGQHNNQRLIDDQLKKSTPFVTWTPNNKNLAKLLKNHLNPQTVKELQKVFPNKAAYIERQFRRSEGEMIPFSKPKANVRDPRLNGQVEISQKSKGAIMKTPKKQALRSGKPQSENKSPVPALKLEALPQQTFPMRHTEFNPANYPDFDEDDIKQLKATFDLFDKNKNGYADIGELVNFMEQLSMQRNFSTVLNLLKKIRNRQTPRQGMSFPEFMDTLQYCLGDFNTQDGVERLFEMLATDQREFIDVQRLKELTEELGLHVSENDLRILIVKYFRCHNEKVDKGSFSERILRDFNQQQRLYQEFKLITCPPFFTGKSPSIFQMEFYKKIQGDISREANKRGPKNSARSNKPFLHNIDRELEDLRQRNRRFDSSIQLELNKLKSIDVLEESKQYYLQSQRIETNFNKNRNGQSLHKINRFPSIFSSSHKRSSTYAKSIKSRDIPRKKLSMSLLTEINQVNNTSLDSPERAQQKSSLDSLLSRCKNLENNCDMNLEELLEKKEEIGVELERIKEEFIDRQELVETHPKRFEDILSTKQYNREIDRVMRNSIRFIQQSNHDLPKNIAELTRARIWKFTTPSFSKRTERLLNSLPTYRFGTNKK